MKIKELNTHLDASNLAILEARVANRDAIATPRIGDFVLFASGELERFSHIWSENIQTSPVCVGSIHLGEAGYGSFSGGLNPGTPSAALVQTKASLPGRFWIFNHGFAGAGRGIDVNVPCRVYTTAESYIGFMRGDYKTPYVIDLLRTLQGQLGMAETPDQSSLATEDNLR